MKQKKIIFILIIAILLAIICDLVLVYLVKKNQEVDSKIKYMCLGENESRTLKDLNISYKFINNYEFEVTKNGKIESGAIISQFIFDSDEDYNAFIKNYDSVTPEERIKKYDKENNKITYIFLNTFPNLNEQEQTQYTDEYLKQIENIGFICEKVNK